jgi:hypothetical protein
MKKENYSPFNNIVRRQKGFEYFQKVIKLAKESPNDTDLGRKVREFILSTSVKQN